MYHLRLLPGQGYLHMHCRMGPVHQSMQKHCRAVMHWQQYHWRFLSGRDAVNISAPTWSRTRFGLVITSKLVIHVHPSHTLVIGEQVIACTSTVYPGRHLSALVIAGLAGARPDKVLAISAPNPVAGCRVAGTRAGCCPLLSRRKKLLPAPPHTRLL